MEIEIDLRRYFLAIKKNIWKVGIVTIISFFVALLLNYKVEENEYSAVSTVYSASFGSYTESIEGVTALKTYSDIIQSKKVADRAALIIGDSELDGEMIKSMITYSFSETSTVYNIEAKSKSPSLSITIANAVANAFVIEMNNITGEDAAQVLDEAYDYEEVFNGKEEQIKNIFLITGIGFLATILVIVLHSFFSRKVISVHDVTLGGKLEIIGVIPNFEIE